MNLLTEAYSRQARLYPALLLIAPVVLTGAAMFSTKLGGLQSLGVSIVGFGGAFLLAQLARDSGKGREPSLYQAWGGMPSVLVFRHGHRRIDPITKSRYHKQLSTLVEGTKAPSAEDELADPIAADQVYAAWSHFLRASTRDTKKFPLLFQENVSYGYRRNVWGLRWIGITLCSLCVVGNGVRLEIIHRSTMNISEQIAGALVVSLIFLLLWLFRFTSKWVRIPAEAYAERLAESVDTLSLKQTVGEKSE